LKAEFSKSLVFSGGAESLQGLCQKQRKKIYFFGKFFLKKIKKTALKNIFLL